MFNPNGNPNVIFESFIRRVGSRRIAGAISTGALALGAFYVASCATSPHQSTPSSMNVAAGVQSVPPPPELNMPGSPPSPDPRVGLSPGVMDSTQRGKILVPAAEASWNLRLLSNTPSPEGFLGVTNSDLAFTGNYVYQGNYNGYQVWDISNPRRPALTTAYLCPASQSDVSVYKHLLFVSGEGTSGRVDCGTQGVQESVSPIRLRGIRIFDVTDITRPRYIANVQTCRGSHTHTVVTDPRDSENVYIYVSGSAGVRSPEELPGCSGGQLDENPSTALFRIEVIRVPLANPERAAIVSSPRIFTGLTAPPGRSGGGRGGAAGDTTGRGGGGAGARAGGGRAGAAGAGGAGAAGAGGAGAGAAVAGGAGRRGGGGGGGRGGPTQCHDITVYPGVGLAGGACGGYGLLLDISDVANPVRIDQAADSNMSFWHSATFSNDGSKVLFSDEWGGGSAPRCRASDRMEWGANALFTIENRKLSFKSYYKMPAAQTELENCVAHNGSLIPIPGREVMVQAWYQGGISVFDWTDVSRPYEIAFYDRGPLDGTRAASAGSWSVYWYNGLIVSSEIARGLDIYELTPSAHITQNEIDAANTVRFEQLNAQEQPKIVWPPSFALTRAFVDQLTRSRGLAETRLATVRGAIASAERATGAQRRSQLNRIATELERDAATSSDQPKVNMLIQSLRDLANATS